MANTGAGFPPQGTGGGENPIVLAEGVFTTSSATAPADNLLTELTGAFDGALIIPQSGPAENEAREIGTFVQPGGIFNLNVLTPFTAAPGLVPYKIIAGGGGSSGGTPVPAPDAVANLNTADVVGNKASTPVYTPDNVSDLVRIVKGILHTEVLAIGTLTTSSTTVPADNTRTEALQAFRGALFMTLAGADAFQPRRIDAFTNGTGVFTLDTGNPLTAVPGLVAYAILAGNGGMQVPSTDSTANRTVPDALGSKADAAVLTAAVSVSALATVSAIAILKALMQTEVVATGTLTTSSATVPADTGKAALAQNHYRGYQIMTISGANPFQPRPIVEFTTGTGVYTIDPGNPWAAAPGLVPYVILRGNISVVPPADSTANRQTADVIGNKADVAVAIASAVASEIAYIKSLVDNQVKTFTKTIVSAANAGAVTVATITGDVNIESIILMAVSATTADLTSFGLTGGAGGVIIFIPSGTLRALIAAADQQVPWASFGVPVHLANTKTIVLTLTGTGATALDWKMFITYRATANGGTIT